MAFKKYFKNGFTVVPNEVLNDPELSAKAKGILFYLMSKPDDWKPRIADVVNKMKDGRDSVRSGVGELVTHGFMLLVYEQGDDGRMDGSSWNVSDTKGYFLEGGDYRGLENPIVDNANTTKERGLVNTDSNQRKSAPTSKSLFRNSGITLEDFINHHAELSDLGVDLAHYFHAIDDWSETKSEKRTVRGWYATCSQWCRKDKVDGTLVTIAGKQEDHQATMEFFNLK